MTVRAGASRAVAWHVEPPTAGASLAGRHQHPTDLPPAHENRHLCETSGHPSSCVRAPPCATLRRDGTGEHAQPTHLTHAVQGGVVKLSSRSASRSHEGASSSSVRLPSGAHTGQGHVQPNGVSLSTDLAIGSGSPARRRGRSPRAGSDGRGRAGWAGAAVGPRASLPAYDNPPEQIDAPVRPARRVGEQHQAGPPRPALQIFQGKGDDQDVHRLGPLIEPPRARRGAQHEAGAEVVRGSLVE